MLLHDAIGKVLSDNKGRGMTVHEITLAVKKNSLYKRRDGKFANTNQVSARINKKSHMFRKNKRIGKSQLIYLK